jgi:steroid 5-alpha reductase family enzyme
MWGLLFVIQNLIILVITNNWNERTILTFTLVCIWAFRLAYHIGKRHKGEDYRY